MSLTGQYEVQNVSGGPWSCTTPMPGYLKCSTIGVDNQRISVKLVDGTGIPSNLFVTVTGGSLIWTKTLS